jgi:hypothetical protein
MEGWTFSDFFKCAEEQLAEAKRAQARGESDAHDRVREWINVLEGLQIMRERGMPESLKDRE